MTPTEAAAILTLCAGYDNRKPDADTAKAWSAALGDLRYTDCRDAVVQHYATKRDWIMPADIRALVNRVRTKRIANDELIDMPPGLDPDDTAAYMRVLAEGRRRLADGEQPVRAELPTRVMGEMPQVGTSLPELERAALRQKIAAAAAAHRAASAPLEPLPAIAPVEVDPSATEVAEGPQINDEEVA